MNVIASSIPMRYDPLTESRVPTIDLSSAARYGKIKVLVPDYPCDRDSALDAVRDGMASYDPEDLLVASGDPILFALAFTLAADTHSVVKCLLWDKGNRCYELVEVTL